MTWWKENFNSWKWKTAANAEFLQQVTELENSIAELKAFCKETLEINRAAAGFFKRCTDATVHWSNIGDDDWTKPKIFKSDFMIQISDENDEVMRNGPAERWCCEVEDEWRTNFIDSDIVESDLVPKEALVIRKETSIYIQSCLSTNVGHIEFQKWSAEINGREKFSLLDFVHQEIDDSTEKKLLQVPFEVPVIKEPDEIFLEEELTECIPLAIESYEACEARKIIITASRFKLEVVKIHEDISREFFSTCADLSWITSTPVDNKYHESLEKFILDESLEKGAIYKVDAPFMSSVPVFKEPLSAFEFSMKPLPVINVFHQRGKLDLKHLLVANLEGDLLEEILDITVEFDEEYDMSCFEKIGEMHSYLIEVSCDRTEAGKQTEPDVLTQEISLLNATTSQTHLIHDSNIRIETTDIGESTFTSDVTNHGSVLDTVGATKMDTFIDKKRILDDDLDKIIAKKRHTAPKNFDTVLDPILHLLRDCDTSESLDLEEKEDDSKYIVENGQTFDPELMKCDHTVIMNSSKLSNNASLLKFFDKFFTLDVLEYELSESDPDFILSSTCGLMIISSLAISQVDSNGIFHYQAQIIENKLKYPDLIVIITILDSSSHSSEQLLNFQLSLSLMKIMHMVVGQNIHSLAESIAMISKKKAIRLAPEDHQRLESPEVSFVVSCGLSPMLSLKVLESVSILQLLTMSPEERNYLEIPPYVSTHFDELCNITWHMDL